MQAYEELPDDVKELVGDPLKVDVQEGKIPNDDFLLEVQAAFDSGCFVEITVGNKRKDCKTLEEALIFMKSHKHRHDANMELGQVKVTVGGEY